MRKVDIIKAWKDSEYYDSLSTEEKAMVPANPAGNVLSDSQLSDVRGAYMAASCTGGGSCCTTKPPSSFEPSR